MPSVAQQPPLFNTDKRCVRCRETKPLSDFHSNRSARDGRGKLCKPCANKAAKDWAAANLDRVRARRKAYYSAHAEEARAYSRQYRNDNIERVRQVERAKRQANPEYMRNYVRANPDKYREYQFRRKAKIRNAPGNATAADIAARWAMWGNLCYMCGAPATCTDHVIPLARGGSNWPANLRPACKSCNCKKRTRDWRQFVTG